MMTIWKFPLKVSDRQVIEMPLSAKILTVQVQGDIPCLWALCVPNVHRVPRTIAIYGTGDPVPNNPGIYVGTFQMHVGTLIFHVFEVSS